MSGILGQSTNRADFLHRESSLPFFKIHELAMKSWRIAAYFDTQFHVKVA